MLSMYIGRCQVTAVMPPCHSKSPRQPCVIPQPKVVARCRVMVLGSMLPCNGAAPPFSSLAAGHHANLPVKGMVLRSGTTLTNTHLFDIKCHVQSCSPPSPASLPVSVKPGFAAGRGNERNREAGPRERSILVR